MLFNMKNNLWYLLFTGILLFSCNKKEGNGKDQILYKSFSPTVDMQSMRYDTLQNHTICSVLVPVPSDSSISYDLDLNDDQTTDFRLVVSHSEHNGSYCGHCSVFTYNIYITGLSEENKIATSGNYSAARIFNESAVIDLNNNWSSRGDLLLQGGCALPFSVSFEEGYIGLRIKDSFGYIKIKRLDKNGVRIIEQGFNKTESNKIICGQKE